MRQPPTADLPSRLTDHVVADVWPHLPSYAKVYAALATAFHAGEYAPGATLPPRRVLCDRYGVSRVTIAQATRMLIMAGLVQNVRRGRALRVVPVDPRTTSRWIRLDGVIDERSRCGRFADLDKNPD